MANDVTLVLKANNSDHIAKMKQAQTETQKVYDIAEKGIKREITILETLQNSLNNIKAKRAAAFDEKEIKKWDDKLKQAEQDLKDFGKTNEKVGDTAKKSGDDIVKSNTKVEKSGNSLLQSVGRWAAGFLSFTAIVSALKNAFQQTEGGLRTFNIIGTVTKQMLYDLVTLNKRAALESIKMALAVNKEFEALRVRQRIEIVEIAKLQTVYDQLYTASADQTKTNAERLQLLDQAYLDHEVIVAKNITNAQEELNVIEQMLIVRPEDTKLLDAHAAKLVELEKIRGDGVAETRRLESQRTGIIKQESDKQIEIRKKGVKDAEDEIIKGQKFFNDYWDKKDKEDADKIAKQKEEEWSFGLGIGKSNFSTNQKNGQTAWDLMIENEKKATVAGKELADMKAEALKQMGTAVLDYIKIVDELAQKEVERTQRERELLDTSVGEAQDALNTEVELYKAGYASNVGAKKKELADLKVARDKALKDEELARKKQHTIELASLVAQKAVDVAKIISSTAVANAKAVAASPLTFGQPWVAINTVAAVLGIAAAVAAVVAASTAKYAKGGWTGDGSYRDETGERVAGTVHEREFVVKKGQAGRYRSLLEAINKDDKRMILHTFNKLSPELLGGTTVNNVIVENEGPNKRLDQVTLEIRKLNSKLTNDSIQNFGSVQVIRKGNSIRTIR